MAKTKNKEDDILDMLEGEIEAQLAEDFDPGVLSEPEEEEAAPPPPKKAKKKVSSKKPKVGELVGKKVVIYDDEEDVDVTAVVKKHTRKEIVVETSEAQYNIDLSDIKKVLEDEEPVVADEPEPMEDSEPEPEEKKPEEVSEQKGSDNNWVYLDISSIQIPKKLVREFKRTEKWESIMANMAKIGQKDAIEVDDVTAKKPILTDGLRRLTAGKELGWTKIKARNSLEDVSEDVGRMFYGLKANWNREDMSWIENAKVFQYLSKNGYKNRKIAKELSISESKVSRMISALSLPKKILEYADDTTYSPSVFFELTKSDEEVQDVVLNQMKSGVPVTVSEVKSLVKEQKKRQEEADNPNPDGGVEETPPEPSDPDVPTSSKIGRQDLGNNIAIQVFKDRVEMKFKVKWDKKSYRGFDPLTAISELFEAAFEDEQVALDSFAGLVKTLKAARAEVG
jgi:ParB/RepB/Spo0J family partition protein